MNAWLVNTNSNPRNGNENGYKYMLRQNKAASFYGRNKAIDKIKKGNLVLIYHNKTGVIAVGAVVKNKQKHDFPDTHHIEHWVDLNWLWKAEFDDENPINPIDCKVLGVPVVGKAVIEITKQLNYKVLFEKICEKQRYL